MGIVISLANVRNLNLYPTFFRDLIKNIWFVGKKKLNEYEKNHFEKLLFCCFVLFLIRVEVTLGGIFLK